MRATAPLLLCWLAAACAGAPSWDGDLAAVLAAGQAQRCDVVLFFALPGREQSDRMQQQCLTAPEVTAALRDGGFLCARIDAFAQPNLYEHWIGPGEGMGVCIVDPQSRGYAARPGPQDAAELAAWLRQAAAARERLAVLRFHATSGSAAGAFALGELLLQLGCRKESELLLIDAAQAGQLDAMHLLARLYALDGAVARARQWLRNAPPSAPRLVTEGYLCFKERRHREAVAALQEALAADLPPAERQRAKLYLGKSLHEIGQDRPAVALLEELSREGSGSTFEAAALHALAHLRDPQHGHAH